MAVAFSDVAVEVVVVVATEMGPIDDEVGACPSSATDLAVVCGCVVVSSSASSMSITSLCSSMELSSSSMSILIIGLLLAVAVDEVLAVVLVAVLFSSTTSSAELDLFPPLLELFLEETLLLLSSEEGLSAAEVSIAACPELTEL